MQGQLMTRLRGMRTFSRVDEGQDHDAISWQRSDFQGKCQSANDVGAGVPALLSGGLGGVEGAVMHPDGRNPIPMEIGQNEVPGPVR